jgi:DNA replication regulator DPB11
VQGKTLQNILTSYDGDIASSLQGIKGFENSSRQFVVVPHNLRKRDCPDISGFGGVSTVTEWWIEACMHKGKFVEPSEGFVYSPFEEFPLEGTSGLTKLNFLLQYLHGN